MSKDNRQASLILLHRMSKHAMLSNVLFMTQSYLRVRREGRGAHRQTRKGHALLLPQKMPMRQHSFQQESVEPPLKCLRIWSRSGVVLDPVQPEAVHQLQNQGESRLLQTRRFVCVDLDMFAHRASFWGFNTFCFQARVLHS